MKVMLFLGSGTSYASGMPTVGEITNDLLQGEWTRYDEGVYLPGSYPGPDPCGFYATTAEQDAIRIIAKEIQDTFDTDGNGRQANYEDIYYVLTRLSEDACNGESDPIVAPYRVRIENFLKPVMAEWNQNKIPGVAPYRTEKLFQNCISLIGCVVVKSLSQPKTISGLELLLDMISDPNTTELLLVTTNHDLLIETLLETNGVSYIDGFSDEGIARGEFVADDLERKCRVKILKLHGSIDWYHAGKKIKKMRKPSPDQLEHFNSAPILLCGSGNKPRSYSYSIFQHIHFHWQKELETCDFMIMSGYGLNDQGINIRIEDWMDRDGSTMVLLHQDPQALFMNSGSMFVETYQEWTRDKRLIVIREWMESARWDDLKKALEDHM